MIYSDSDSVNDSVSDSDNDNDIGIPVVPAHPAPGVVPHGHDRGEEAVAEADHGHAPGQAQVGGALAVNDAGSDGLEAGVSLGGQEEGGGRVEVAEEH